MASPTFAPIPRDGREEAIWRQLKRLLFFQVDGEVGVTDITYPYGDVRRFGAVSGSSAANQAANSTAIQNAVTSAASGDRIYVPFNLHYDTTLQVDTAYLTLAGPQGQRVALFYYGAGAAIQLGTDNGHAYDAADYDGVQGFGLDNLGMIHGAPDTTLDNGLASYRAGSYGIRDWRGGLVRLTNCTFSKWDYPFWGIQSDINAFRDLIISSCHSGFYFGPRSDQGRFDHLWTFHNDQVFFFEGSRGHLVTQWITDSDGSASSNPVKVRNSVISGNTRITSGIVFKAPWLESLSGGSSAFDVEAFFDLNVGDATRAGPVVIQDPIVLVQAYNTPSVQHTLYMVKADNTHSVVVEGLTGTPGQVPWNNLRAVFDIVGSGSTPRIVFSELDNSVSSSSRLIESYNTSATTFVQTSTSGFGVTYGQNIVGGTGVVSMSTVGLQRSFQHNNAAMSGGTAGDVLLDRTYAAGKPLGWVWDGSAAHPIHVPTVGADRGDADATLLPASDAEEQLWGTALTANRTATLSTTSALNGHRFRIVRSAAATGAFTLDVGGLKTLTTAGQWCEVMYNGSGWVLRAYGSL